MKKFSILVIADNVETSTSLQEILTTNDFVVKSANTGKMALEMLADEIFDLIFIETSLREMDSFAFCRSIKANENFSDPSVIFIIDPDKLDLIQNIYEAGGDDYIQKSLICCELITKARVLLELKYSRMMATNMNQMLEDKVAQRTLELEESLNNLKEAKKELEILEIAKSEFLNLISHEIRTPLNGILGSMALIGRYNLADEVNRYFFEHPPAYVYQMQVQEHAVLLFSGFRRQKR